MANAQGLQWFAGGDPRAGLAESLGCGASEVDTICQGLLSVWFPAPDTISQRRLPPALELQVNLFGLSPNAAQALQRTQGVENSLIKRCAYEGCWFDDLIMDQERSPEDAEVQRQRLREWDISVPAPLIRGLCALPEPQKSSKKKIHAEPA